MKREDIQWALVTGASSGIGEHLSHLLASKGINIIIHGRDQERLQQIAAQLQKCVEVEIVCADLSDPKQRHPLVDVIWRRVPELIVNNAGFGLYGDALTYVTSQQMAMAEANGSAVLELTLEGARALISKGKKGVIMNVASAAAYPVFPRFAVYSATKAFVVHLSESLDEEMRPYGIRVLTACPGMVKTQFRMRAGGAPEEQGGSAGTMSSTFAAKEIWNQIQDERKVNIFNWMYRLTTFFVLYLLPKRWVAQAVKRNIDERHPPQPIITEYQGKNQT